MIYAFYISFYCCSHEKKHKRSLTPVCNKKISAETLYALLFTENSKNIFLPWLIQIVHDYSLRHLQQHNEFTLLSFSQSVLPL